MNQSDAEWWQAINPYLDEALECLPDERAAWLATLRQRHPDIADRLETLLVKHDALAQQGFLEGGSGILPYRPVAAGSVVGAYTLLALIGEGGMGSVWLGERSDGELQQRVAIKFLGAGGHRPSWHDRFLRERQLLASLSHPSIVRVLDAGRTHMGVPYLVMEYVEGRPIDLHAAALSVHERLALFLLVCDAVSHAHQHLIIHRDLKPSNILVDNTGQPKLLDFGIAKVVDESADRTQTSERMLTPGYASPEQLRGAPQTTATDVYSLGAVLYKLATGRSPLETRQSTTANGACLAEAADIPPASRQNRSLPSDLDYILAKALRAEPGERYVSVDALANDVRALLGSRPIAARTGDTWYRTRKFVRRYRVPVAATAAVIVSLSAALYVVNRERVISQRRFDQVRQIAGQLFNVEQDINALPGATAARERIVSTSLEYLEALAKDAGNDLDLKWEIASGYRKVASVQGVFGQTNLGRPEEARASLQKAEALLRELWRARPGDRRYVRELIETVNFENRTQLLAKDFTQVDVTTRELESLLTAYEPLAREDVDDWAFLANIYDSMSLAMTETLHLPEAAALAQRSTGYRRKVAAQDASSESRAGLANSLVTYSRTARLGGEFDEALRALDEAIGLIESILKESPANYKAGLNLANTLILAGRLAGDVDGPSLGRVDEAVGYFERALRIGRELMATDANETLIRYNHSLGAWRLGDVIRDRNPMRALAAYDEAIAILRAMTPANFRRDIPLVNVLAESTIVLRRLNRDEDARRRLNEARQLAQPYDKPPASLLCGDVVTRAEADWALASNRPEEAAAMHRAFLAAAESEAAGLKPASDLSDAFTLARHYGLLADALARSGQRDEAAQAESRRRGLIDIWQKKLPATVSVASIFVR